MQFLLLRSAPVIALVLLSSAVASANEVYSYVGNTFDTITDNTPPDGTYTSSMRVTGSFELAEALAPNLTNVFIPLTAVNFAFSDGRSTITSSDPFPVSPVIFVDTDAFGNISEWNILLLSSLVLFDDIGDQLASIASTQFFDQVVLFECVALSCSPDEVFDSGARFFSPGTWTQMTVGSPVPSFGPLGIAMLLSVMGAAGYRKLSGQTC